MKLSIELNKKTKNPLKKTFFDGVLSDVLKTAKFTFLSEKDIEISVAIVSDEEIRYLNNLYRKVDAVTDVLSFPEYEKIKDIKKEPDGFSRLFLGEIVLCYNNIKEYCQKNNINLEEELRRVVAHGFLHLLGFSHGKEMFGIQENVAKIKVSE